MWSSKMVETASLYSDFEYSTSNLAVSTVDGPLRLWDSSTGKLLSEYLHSSHLTAVCTCLKWKPSSSCHSTRQRKTKKSKVNHVSEESDYQSADESKIVAIGSATGEVNLYNVDKGEVQCQLKSTHNTEVTAICWSEDGTSLYSGYSDGLVIHWDTLSGKQKRHWKSSKSGVTSLAVCGQSHILVASLSISMWDLDSLSIVQSFTGHATDILQIHSILTDVETLDIKSLHLISVASDDRVVSLWAPSSKSSKSKRAKASFILENEPIFSTVHYDRAVNRLRLAVLTTAKTVELFEHELTAAANKKPIKALHVVSITKPKPSGKPLPLLACKLGSDDGLLLAYGTEVSPAFHTLQHLSSLGETEVKIEKEDPSKAQPVTKVTSMGNVRQPKLDGNVTTLTPAVEGGKRLGAKRGRDAGEKRPLEEGEATIEEKLALLRGGATDKPTEITGPTDSLATVLSQALQSDDVSMLKRTLSHGDAKVINTTIRRLPLSCVMPLMKHLTLSLASSGSGKGDGTANIPLVKWIKALLHIHASYLATFPELVEKLQKMYNIVENRVAQVGSFTRLQGRLDLTLSQIARQKDDEQGAEASAALLTLQDESSGDEMMDELDMMMVHSESEDGYLSADEDDLVK